MPRMEQEFGRAIHASLRAVAEPGGRQSARQIDFCGDFDALTGDVK